MHSGSTAGRGGPLNFFKWKGALALAGLLVLAVALLAYRPVRHLVRDITGFEVPAHGGQDTCQVRFYDSVEAVRSRCGPPCNAGGAPKGDCPDSMKVGFISFCSWDCDQFGSEWVCYIGGQVIDVGSDLHVVPFGECSWSRR